MFINFVTYLILLQDKKSDDYHLILFFVNKISKISYYKYVKMINNILNKLKVIIKINLKH